MAKNSPISNSVARALEQSRQNKDDKTKEKKKASKKAKQGEEEEKTSPIRKEPDKKKRPIWHHEWTSPKLLATDGNFGIREIVQGPFISPRLVVASPCVVEDPSRSLSNVHNRFCKRAVGVRHGIPDPWIEYLALRGYCTEYDRRIAKRHLLLGCDSVRLTEAVWNQLGLTFTQGIPDPWKICPYEARNIPREKTLRSQRRKSRIILRGTSKDPTDLCPDFPTENPVSFATVINCTDEKRESRAPDTWPIKNPTEHSSRSHRAKKLPKKGSKLITEQQQQDRRNRDMGLPGKSRVVVETLASIKDERLPCGILEKDTSRNKTTQVSCRWQQEPRYHCRLYQPEVTSTKRIKATRMKGENLWRCIKHQPGSSYRLEATKISGKTTKCHRVAESEDPMTVGSDIVRGPCLSRCKGKSVVGMMRSLLVGLRERSDYKEPRNRYWNGDDERNPRIDLICCRCSCPYLKVADRPDCNARPYFDCPKKARKKKRTEKQESFENSPGHNSKEEEDPEIRASVARSVDEETPRASTILETQENPTRERTFEDQGKSIDKVPEETFQLPVEVGNCKFEKFVEFVSPESGANADISDASIRTNVGLPVNSVTSSTLIDLMRNKSNERTAMLVQNQDCRDVCAKRSGRENRRAGKRACIIDKRLEETTLQSCPYTERNYTFKGFRNSVVERRSFGGETEGCSRVDYREFLPDLSLEARSLERPLDGSPDPPVLETNDDADEYNRQKESLSEDGECLFIIDDAVNGSVSTTKSDHRRNFSGGDNTRKQVNKRTTPPLVGRETNKYTASGMSTVQVMDDQHSRTPETARSNAPRRPNVDHVESKEKTSRGTDTLGVEPLLGRCVRKKNCWRNYRAIVSCPNTDRHKKSPQLEPFSRTHNEGREISGKFYEMVEPFVKEISDANNQSGKVDEPEIEILNEEDNMAASNGCNGRLEKSTLYEKSPTGIGFFANSVRNRASRSGMENSFERKSKDPSDEELFVQSYSEAEDNLEE